MPEYFGPFLSKNRCGLTDAARCCFSIPHDVFSWYRKATPGCNGLKRPSGFTFLVF